MVKITKGEFKSTTSKSKSIGNRQDFKNDRNMREINKKRGTNIAGASKSVVIETHPKFPDIYIGRGKEDVLLTLNMIPGTSVYNEKRLTVEKNGEKTEYRFWNCFRSKLAAGIVCGLEFMSIKSGTTVLYLGASSGTTLSHVSDIVGPDTLVYAVEFSTRSGRDLINLATKRANIVPIIADARNPSKYRMLVPMVDTIFSDISQADQSKIVMENAQYFLKDEGVIMISVKASCVDSSIPAEQVFVNEINWLKRHDFKPKEQVTLEPYEKNHAMIVGIYKPTNKTTE